MVERRRYVKPGPKRKHAGNFVQGNVDGRANNGRPPGALNKLPLTVKQALCDAMEMYGSDGKGKDKMVGYFYKIISNVELGARLAEKLMPLQVTGEGGGPVRVMDIPTYVVKLLSTDELVALESALRKVGGLTKEPLTIEHQPQGDADRYAKELGLNGSGTKH